MKSPFICLSTCLLFVCISLPCLASSDDQLIDTIEDSAESAGEKGKSFMDKMVFAPMPMANPTLGAGLVGAALYMHPLDSFGNDKRDEEETTLQSISGVAIMGTSNESWAAGIYHKGFYDNDKYRGTVFLGYGELKLKYYGVGKNGYAQRHPVKYTANILGFQPKLLTRISDNWYLGPEYRYMRWTTSFNLSEHDDRLPDLEGTLTTAGGGIAGEWDTTNHSVYPSKGGKFEFRALDYGSLWGGDYDYFKYESNYNHFFSLTERLVLATRADLNLSSGSTPFFDMSYLHLRGFPYAQYIDKQSASVQGELRWKMTKKWMANLFGGLGWIADKPEGLINSKTVPTGGAGINYLLAEDQSMYIGMDVAFGPDSSGVYFQVGEWF